MEHQVFVLNIKGKTQKDLDEAIDQAAKMMKEGYREAFDENEDGSYHVTKEYDEKTDSDSFVRHEYIKLKRSKSHDA